MDQESRIFSKKKYLHIDAKTQPKLKKKKKYICIKIKGLWYHKLERVKNKSTSRNVIQSDSSAGERVLDRRGDTISVAVGGDRDRPTVVHLN